MLVLFAGRARAFQHAAPARVETRAFAKKAKKAPKASAPRRAELPPGAATPKLIVFDLDNTLWSPELYQLRKKPKANKDVRLCAGAVDALYDLATGDWPRTEGAVASRATEADWAEDLLAAFEVEGRTAASLLPHREIYPGSKRKHFQALRKTTGVDFSDMIFFDDYTENLGEIAQLGVMCVHNPRGLTWDHWAGGLKAYARLKEQKTEFMGRMFTTADLRELD